MFEPLAGRQLIDEDLSERQLIGREMEIKDALLDRVQRTVDRLFSERSPADRRTSIASVHRSLRIVASRPIFLHLVNSNR